MKPAGSTLPFYAVIVALVVVIAVGLAKCGKVSTETSSAMPRSTPGPAPLIAPAADVARSTATVLPVVSPVAATLIATPIAPAEVAIENGKTIDFSSGKPVVRDAAKEKEIIDLAVKEMDAAANSITFGASAPTPTAVATPAPATTPH